METKLEKRAIKIVELQEELEVAKKILHDFVFPPDGTEEERQRLLKKAARFIGTEIHFDIFNETKSELHPLMCCKICGEFREHGHICKKGIES